MTRSSGFATFQTSLTPSAQTCGFSPWSPKWSIAAPVRWPCVPSASTVHPARMSDPARSWQLLAVAAAALVPGADAEDAAVETSSFSPDVSGRIVARASSACSPSQRPSCESDAT